MELDIKYQGYTERQKEMVERARRLEERKIPNDIAYQRVSGLSREVVEKLSRDPAPFPRPGHEDPGDHACVGDRPPRPPEKDWSMVGEMGVS